MSQLLFELPSPLEQAFWKCHEENPEIYKLFCRFAHEAIDSGREHFGAGAIWERMRWFTMVEEKRGDYKLNNNHRAYYSRLFVLDHPDYSEFFRIRKQRIRSTIETADIL